MTADDIEFASHRPPHLDVTQYAANMTVMSVGPKGREWLDEHAPDWYKHVTIRQFQAVQTVPGITEAKARDRGALLALIRHNLIGEIAKRLVEAYEPDIAPMEDGNE